MKKPQICANSSALYFIEFCEHLCHFYHCLAITNRRFYPKRSEIRAHMYHATIKYRLAKLDQEKLALKVEQWKLEHPNDMLFFRPYGQHYKGKCHSSEIN